MATLKLAVVPAKVAKDGTHKIRVAIGHKKETRYIVTRFKIESLSHFKNGQVVGFPDASLYNVKLRNILNGINLKTQWGNLKSSLSLPTKNGSI